MLYNLDFLRVGEPWPPPSEAKRLKKYRENRLLWKGEHTEVYGDWWRVLREEYGVSHEIVFNFHARVTTLFADLTWGDAPVIVAKNEGAQDSIDDIVDRSGFSTAGYEASMDLSRYGDALFKLRLKDGLALPQVQSPSIWFPIVSRDDQREIVTHVLAWPFEVDKTTYLRAEIHEKGLIRNKLFTVSANTITGEVDLTAMFPDRKEEEETRLPDEFMVFHVPGLRASDEFYGRDDYQDLDSLVLERMGRTAQLSKIQDQHSDPNMYGHEDLRERNSLTGEWEFAAGGKFYPVPPGESPPGYLTWDASQDQQFRLMETLKEDLYEISETTPTAFGSSTTGYAESGTSLRLRMVPPLSKARRRTRQFEPVVKKLLTSAVLLEAAWDRDGSPPEAITITWKDGLPNDPQEQAQIQATRLESGSTSRYSAIRRLDGGTDKEINDEIERIAQEEAERRDNSAEATDRNVTGPSNQNSLRR